MAETVEMVRTLTLAGATRLEASPVRPDIQVALHPSALRQVLITAARELVQNMPAGQVTLSAERKEGRALIEIAGRPAPLNWAAECDLIREILAEGGGTLEFSVDNQRACFSVRVPRVDTVAVLVIDDNVDLVHFYRRYTQGTRYRIAHLAEGARAVEAIEASRPDVIVLDVMLPDVDGWQLLTDLHEHPLTRSIPIVLCSVIREEELALALGASLYLPKPVRRQALLRALDQVIGPGAVEVMTTPASN
jgi:CheY-like chemotaxis protein